MNDTVLAIIAVFVFVADVGALIWTALEIRRDHRRE